jgi:hypothetical protein
MGNPRPLGSPATNVIARVWVLARFFVSVAGQDAAESAMFGRHRGRQRHRDGGNQALTDEGAHIVARLHEIPSRHSGGGWQRRPGPD